VQKVVSIITPSFNRADIISETAESIFGQTYPHWEWMIVDDGSTDNSWEVIQEFAKKDKRVRIFQRDREPKGACVCRNIAVENATGDYVIFLDTDDLLASFCLEQRVAAMEAEPDCDFIIFPMLLFKSKPDDLKVLWSQENGRDDLLRILEGDPICQGTGTLWKRSTFMEVGMWRVDLRLWQDIELHIRSLLWPVTYKKRMDLIPDVFLRISDISLSRTGFHSLPKLKSRIQVFHFAAKRLTATGKMNFYKESLAHMGKSIYVSAVNSNFFTEAAELLRILIEYNLADKSEKESLQRFMMIRKYRLYHLPAVNKYYLNKVMGKDQQPPHTIGQIKWEKEVQL
jgi:glycosyltransferase involved in cell wall biosynthesis